MFTAKFHSKFLKQIEALHQQDKQKFLKKLKRFKKNPFSKSFDTKKLTGSKSTYRWRLGNIRAIYSINSKKKTVYFWEIGYRGQLY